MNEKKQKSIEHFKNVSTPPKKIIQNIFYLFCYSVFRDIYIYCFVF